MSSGRAPVGARPEVPGGSLFLPDRVFDRWYRDVAHLPRGVQLAALKLGGRIAKLLPGGKSKG